MLPLKALKAQSRKRSKGVEKKIRAARKSRITRAVKAVKATNQVDKTEKIKRTLNKLVNHLKLSLMTSIATKMAT